MAKQAPNIKRLWITYLLALALVPVVAAGGQRQPRRVSAPPAPAATRCDDSSHDAHAANADPAKSHDEHHLLFCRALASQDATHRATASGAWSNPNTWGGKLPAADAKVMIPQGITVTVDRELDAPLFWIHVEGVLRFAPEANTSIVVDTLAIDSTGRLEIGTAAKPIPSGTTARVIIKARGGTPIDQNWDPLELTRGLIAHGAVEMHGAQKTPFVSLSTIPASGSRSLVVDTQPAGWMPGDEIVLTATAYDQDETFRLERVAGTTIYLDHPIKNTRSLPVDANGKTITGLSLHLGNLTRNVQVRSAAESAGNSRLQGHVMLMHRGGHKLAWVGFHDLGRTTVNPVSDPIIRESGRDASVNPAVGITQENIRGRYSLHFHRAGPSSVASIVEGCAITVRRGAGFKIGIGNHSSNVSVRRCVSHNIDGSHFFTEEGDELGDFTGDLAIHSVGSGFVTDPQPRDALLKNDPALYNRRRLDVGHRGTGFWLNGGGVDVIDNVAAGQANAGFNLWTTPLNWRLGNTYTVRFPVSNLRSPSWASGEDLSVEDVPSRLIGNTVYALSTLRNRGEGPLIIANHGMHTKSRFPNAPYSQIYGFLSWNAGGIKAAYSGNLHLKDVRVIGSFSRADAVGVRLGTQGGNNGLIENVSVEGFTEGIRIPAESVIRGGTFATYLALPLSGNHRATVDLTGMSFAKSSAPAPAAGPRSAARATRSYDLYVFPIFSGGELDIRTSFAPQPIYIKGHPSFPQGGQLYSLEQHPDYILPDLGVPGLLDGKTTTGEAWEKYRLAPGGAVAPRESAPLSGIRSNGIFGPAVIPPTAAASDSYGQPASRRGPASPSTEQRGSRSTEQRGSRVVDATQGRLPNRAAARPMDQSRQRQPDSPADQTADQTGNPQERETQRGRDASQRSSRQPAEAATSSTEPQETAQDRQARRAAAQQERADRRAGDRRNPQTPTGSDAVATPPAGWQLVSQGGQWTLVSPNRRVQLPAVNAGTDQTVSVGESAVLNGMTGGRQAMAQARWSRAFGPGSVTFDDPTNLQTRARFSAPGIYVLHLTVQDQAGLKNTAPLTITVER